jgi:4-hydroxymandelate oxidase
VSEQKRFHAEGEVATAKGAAAAKAFMIVSSRSSMPLDQIAAANKNFWYQVYASDAAAKTQIADGVKAGAKAIVITVGASPAATAKSATPVAVNWTAVDSLKQGVTVPVVVKGITTPADATAALQHGAQGIIVSNYGGLLTTKDAPILDLAKIVDAVAGKAPVLVDGSFRRGTDVLKALAFGAQGVIVARPVMWGLAAYGDAGVQGVVENAADGTGPLHGHVREVDDQNARPDRRESAWSDAGQDLNASAWHQQLTEVTVGNIENKWKTSMSRRKAIAGLGTMIAGSPLLHAQLDPRPLPMHKRTAGLDEMLTAFDFEPVMFANIPQATYDYTAHGDGGEHTLRRNRRRSTGLICARKAIDPKTVDLSTQVFDFKLKYPIIIAPSATQVALHPEGEAGMYRAGVSCANTADDPQQQLRPRRWSRWQRRQGAALVAVLSAPGPRRQP